MKRWWVYQRERFPVLAHGPLIAAFSACAVSYAAMLTDGPLPMARAYLVAFVTSFIFFLQLRLADEFKDKEEDARYRPYRPVPRGLVKLNELRVLFIMGGVCQFILAWWHAPGLLWILLFAWTYLSLMCVEFFARDWLVARPITYLWTHMLIMPIVDYHATATYWMAEDLRPGMTLLPFLAASFCNGLVIEIGRKIRRRSDEEEGVPTYSKLWGSKRAAYVWFACVGITLAFSLIAAHRIGAFALHGLCMLPVVACVIVAGLGYLKGRSSGKAIEIASAIWTLLLYFSLGLLPLIISLIAHS